jgi:hypothetical protein
VREGLSLAQEGKKMGEGERKGDQRWAVPILNLAREGGDGSAGWRHTAGEGREGGVSRPDRRATPQPAAARGRRARRGHATWPV